MGAKIPPKPMIEDGTSLKRMRYSQLSDANVRRRAVDTLSNAVKCWASRHPLDTMLQKPKPNWHQIAVGYTDLSNTMAHAIRSVVGEKTVDLSNSLTDKPKSKIRNNLPRQERQGFHRRRGRAANHNMKTAYNKRRAESSLLETKLAAAKARHRLLSHLTSLRQHIELGNTKQQWAIIRRIWGKHDPGNAVYPIQKPGGTTTRTDKKGIGDAHARELAGHGQQRDADPGSTAHTNDTWLDRYKPTAADAPVMLQDPPAVLHQVCLAGKLNAAIKQTNKAIVIAETRTAIQKVK